MKCKSKELILIVLLPALGSALSPPQSGWTSRRNAAQTVAAPLLTNAVLSSPLPAQAAPKSGSELRENVAQVASKLPGYGQPDVFYPASFLGSWQCGRELVSVEEISATAEGAAGNVKEASNGESTAVLAAGSEGSTLVSAALQDAKALLNQPLSYRVRFIENNGHVVADRAFNELNKAKAIDEALGRSSKGRSGAVSAAWVPENANILTITSSDGSVREEKVTKRSFEEPQPGSFGSSEYRRVTVAAFGGVPTLAATRLQTRYRSAVAKTSTTDSTATAAASEGTTAASGTAGDSSAVVRIEGLELEKYYPPIYQGAEPPPVLVLKSRIVYRRALPSGVLPAPWGQGL